MKLESLTYSECEKTLFKLSGKDIKAREESKRLNENTLKVSMIITDETSQKLLEVRGLIPKRLTNDQLLTKMANFTIEQLKKKKFKII